MKKLFTNVFLLFCFVLLAGSSYAQRTITGVITDRETSESLIGANVLVKGTTVGTITDIDGSFSLDVPADADVLVISYAGYSDQEITIGESSVVNVALGAGALLDEIVVVGYGAVKKRDLTGSVASLKEDDFNKGVVISSDQLLQGRVPGVNVINNSGQPGGQATVKVRGNNSIRAGADPLYVVDGVPLDGRTAKAGLLTTDIGNIENSNPLNFLNPSDIASIDVLKDASAAAIYGARASNGVIQITTKKAREGDVQMNFNVSAGVSNVLKKYDVLDAAGYRSALNQYGLTSGDGGGSSDAFDEITRNGNIQNYNFSVGTGGENARVRFSAGYQNVQGVIKESGIKRYSGTLNAQYDAFNDRAGVDFFVVSSHTTEDIAPISTNAGFTGNLVGQALQWNPTIPLTTNGEFTTALNNEGVGATTINPLQLLSAHNEIANTTSLLGSISPFVNITDNLQYRYRFGINYGTGITRGTITKDINVQGIEGLGFAGFSSNQLVTNLHSHTLNFNTDLSSSLGLNLLVGYEYQKFDFSGYAFGGFGFDDVTDNVDIVYALQNSNNDNRQTFSFANPISELQSFFGRANVGVGDNLNITATLRADGSTKFGDNNKYGVFPSFAIAYDLGSMLGAAAFDNLKLRAGWGITGNQEFPAGSALNRFGLLNNAGIGQENPGNPDLQWEESSTINVGVDFGMFDYRVAGTIEYYNRVTSNLLLDPVVSEPGPPLRAWKNIDGELVNSGVEIGLTTFIVDTESLGFNVGLNLAFLTNELRNYSGADILTGNLFGQGSSGAFVQKHVDGMPLNTFFVRDYQGLDESGNSIYANDGNPMLMGDPNADIIAGLSLGLDVAGLNIGMNWNGAFGHDLYNNTAMSVIPIGNLGNRNVDANLIGSANESIANPIASSSRYIESGNFIKLANAVISYDLGAISAFDNISVSLSGNNLLLITDYTGFDPEINTVNLRNGIPSAGIEYIPYPSARTFLLGINASF